MAATAFTLARGLTHHDGNAREGGNKGGRQRLDDHIADLSRKRDRYRDRLIIAGDHADSDRAAGACFPAG